MQRKQHIIDPRHEKTLITELMDPAVADNPRLFTSMLFPWGQENTPLAKIKEPRRWQIAALEQMRDHIKKNRERMALGQPPLVYRDSTVSGRGIGKTAFMAMLNLWLASTRLGATSIVTANTASQLESRTWAEFGKWHTLALNNHWFERTATKLKPAEWFGEVIRQDLKIDTAYYYVQCQLWSEERPDDFAGAHNNYGMMLMMDEASGIPSPVWKVSEGFFTDPILDRYWFVFSNGRRNSGEFFECFHKNRDYWYRRHLDSRSVEGTDHNYLNSIVQRYGEDSDEARVEVKGMFPQTGDSQFIGRDVIQSALDRDLDAVTDPWAPLLMGVDPARKGKDKTVIRWRQGRNGRVIAPTKIKGADNMQVANMIAELINRYNPDAVFIDAGNGTGIIDRLRELGYKVREVWFGTKSPKPQYANFKTYLWGEVRDWLAGAAIDNDPELIDDLSAPNYDFEPGTDRIALETKKQLDRRGIASPDDADALACTFAEKVAPKNISLNRGIRARNMNIVSDLDFNLFS